MNSIYYKYLLTNGFSLAYDELVEAITRRDNTYTIYMCDEEQSKNVIKAVLLDHPELYYCNLNFINREFKNGNVILHLTYNDYDENLFNTELQKIYSDIDKQLNPNMNNWMKSKIIFEYFVKTFTENTAAFDAFRALDLNNVAHVTRYLNQYGTCFNAYGIIVNKSAVCMGFSLAYKLIMEHYDIICYVSMGEAWSLNDRETKFPHNLNVVEIDNIRAYVDTLNSRVCNLNMIVYDYFMVNEEIIKEIYVPEVNFNCYSLVNSYFYRNNLLFTKLSLLRRYLSSYIFESTKGEIRFLYYNNDVSNDYLIRLITDMLNRRIPGYRIVSYSVNNRKGNCLLEQRKE